MKRLLFCAVLTAFALSAAEPVLMPCVSDARREAVRATKEQRPMLKKRLDDNRRRRAQLFRDPMWNVVDDKPLLPVSKDPHDYLSMGPYWWPDPSKPDGLPYIRRDCQLNPATAKLDNQKLAKMRGKVVRLAGLAYFEGDKEAGRRAVEQLRVFFLDPKTRMNPHLKYGQAVPGRSSGRVYGLIDLYTLVDMTDALGMLVLAGALPEKDMGELRKWFGEMARWMITDPMNESDKKICQNHGLSFRLVVVSFSLMTGDEATAREYAAPLPKLIHDAINDEGGMVEEAVRPDAWHYHLYAMGMLLRHCETSRKLGVDLLAPELDSGKRIRLALDRLAQAIETKKCPCKQKNKWSPNDLGGHLMRMYGLSGERKWLDYLRKLDAPTTEALDDYFYAPEK